MAKKRMKWLVWLLLMSLLLSNVTSCIWRNEDEQETEEPVLPAETVDLIRDKASEYVIIYNFKNAVDTYLTDNLWNLLWEQCGVSLARRSDSVNADYEIVIGDAARDGVADLKSKMADENDFVIRQDGKRLFLYAETAEGAKRLIITLRDIFIPKCEEGKFSVEKDLLYVNSLQPTGISDGARIQVFDEGGTDYKIVYGSNNADDERLAYYLRSEMKRILGYDVAIATDRSSEEKHEILIGSSDMRRDAYQSVRSTLGNEDFAVAVSGEKLVLAATETATLLLAVEYFCSNYLNVGKGALVEAESYSHMLYSSAFTVPYERLAILYREALDRYPTIYDYNLSHEISRDARRDQAKVEVMLERMGLCYVFSVGKSSFLYDGYIRKLDRTDYSRNAVEENGEVKVPANFVGEYFGMDQAEDTMIALSDLAQSKGYRLYRDTARNLVFMIPSEGSSFENDGEAVGEYTVGELKDRMAVFFDNPEMPEPSNNTEQSRVVIEDAVQYFPEDTLDSSQPTYISYYSPSVLTVPQADGTNVLYSSNERCSVKGGAEPSSRTVIHKSVDGGKTWTVLFIINELKWASLFLVEDRVYIVGFHSLTGGSNGEFCIGEVVEGKSMNMRTLWKKIVGCIEPLVADGYLYLPLDFGVASVEISKDITDVNNWTLTQAPAELITKQWFTATSGKPLNNSGSMLCQEGNIVKGRGGNIYAVYRVETQPNGGYAVMLKLSDDRKTLELLPNGGSLIRMPTTVTMFRIKYDVMSNRYICISNWYMTENACRARNVLGISYSDNLTDWVTVDTLLVDRQIINSECSCWKTAFQYVDWDYDGDDIVMVVREATGFTNTFHDGKYLTFYRISDFREQFDFKVERLGYQESSNGDEVVFGSGTPIA